MRLLIPLLGVLTAPAVAQQNWLSEDFDTFPPAGWSTTDSGVGGWTSGVPFASAPLVIDGMAFHGDYVGACDSRLISPALDLSAASGPIWAHWYDYMNRFQYLAHHPMTVGDGASTLEVSLDGGATWTVIWIENRTGGQGHANHVDLSSYAGQASVSLSWRYGGDDAHWWGVDEVRVDASQYGHIRTVLNPANGHEYVHTYKGDWAWANAAAADFGLPLVSIQDLDENDFVWREFVLWDSVASVSPRFIPRSVWLGATDENVEGNWEWLDGSPWAFTNWSPGEPDNDPNGGPNGEDYARIDVLDGRWLDKNGEITIFTVLEREPPPVGPQLTITGPCPGTGTVKVTGATPTRQVFVAWSPNPSTWTLLFTPCAGTVFGIANPNLVASGFADANGEFTKTRTIPAAGCGVAHIQALDAATCSVTNVVSL